MKLSLIVPAYNEAENIVDVLKTIENALDMDYEIVVVNDHSSDATAELVRGLSKEYGNIRLIENTYEKGFANAIKVGLFNSSTDVVVPVMGDLCDDLYTIKEMLAKINEGYDVVCGSRYTKGGARIGGPKLKALLSRFSGISLHYLFGIPATDMPNSFKMYRRKVIESIDIKAKSFEISMEILLKAYFAGFKITEVSTVWKERTRGKSSFKVFKLLPSYLKLYAWAILKRIGG
jgi:glycosyltransferase involved in cell wall biosynthesis